MNVRVLQQCWRRHRDVTPMGYLRGVRIACAHRDLQERAPGDNGHRHRNQLGLRPAGALRDPLHHSLRPAPAADLTRARVRLERRVLGPSRERLSASA
jgi:hypothetical protein